MCLAMKETEPDDYSPPLLRHIHYEHLIAGLGGGVISTFSLHPFDVLKIRLAVNDDRNDIAPKYTSIRHGFVTIFREEGLGGLYRGVLPNALGSGLSWGLYFLFYNSTKLWMQNGDSNAPLPASRHLLAATQAGIGTVLVTNPIWVVKTRMILQYGSGREHRDYTGVLDTLAKIYRREGVAGYYRGLVPGLFGVSHGAVQFVVYEKLKNEFQRYNNRPISQKLDTVNYLLFAAWSKFVAVMVTYPYQVVRARLQNQHYVYKGNMDVIAKTWMFEGWRGFYKGLGTNLVKVVPATMLTFAVYEHISHFMMD